MTLSRQLCLTGTKNQHTVTAAGQQQQRSKHSLLCDSSPDSSPDSSHDSSVHQPHHLHLLCTLACLDALCTHAVHNYRAIFLQVKVILHNVIRLLAHNAKSLVPQDQHAALCEPHMALGSSLCSKTARSRGRASDTGPYRHALVS